MPSRSPRLTFLAKAGGALALSIVADRFFLFEGVGATLGVFALCWVGLLFLTDPLVRRARAARVAAIAAALFAVVLIDDPSLLAWTLFWTTIVSATLLPRRSFDDAAQWAGRLVVHAVLGLATPIRDAHRLARVRRRRRSGGIGRIVAVGALPVIGGGVFIALFAGANPLIGNALSAIELPAFWDWPVHIAFAGVVMLAVWPVLRPRGTIVDAGTVRASTPLDLSLATLILSLIVFNAIFAVENALDILFLWRGAALPAGVTAADYAHRGAYPLIVTALLAGLFVVVALRPGSAGAASRVVRHLVALWVAQNLLLVASSVLRTLDYIRTSELTILRISALAWMALVAIGLILICWRMLAAKSSAWLINTNAAAAGIVLIAASVVDLGATAAAWNVGHARKTESLDLCYIATLGPSALLPLIALEHRAAGPRLRDQAAALRTDAYRSLASDQGNWHRWTWRGARRLAQADARLGPHPRRPRAVPNSRGCDGSPIPLPPPETDPAPPFPAPTPLTKAPQP